MSFQFKVFGCLLGCLLLLISVAVCKNQDQRREKLTLFCRQTYRSERSERVVFSQCRGGQSSSATAAPANSDAGADMNAGAAPMQREIS
jgi:hypothetical protein